MPDTITFLEPIDETLDILYRPIIFNGIQGQQYRLIDELNEIADLQKAVSLKGARISAIKIALPEVCLAVENFETNSDMLDGDNE